MSRRFMSNNPKWRGGKPKDFKDSDILPPLPPSGMLFYLDFKYDDKHYTKKEIKRVYSDIDPYGEENWEE